MQRTRLTELKTWLKAKTRLPLVIRGARQVGKTWLVRQLARNADLQLIELNFEERKQDSSLFRTNDPHTTIREIGASRGITIQPSQSLLFLDEIQVVPELLAKLRWFAEKMPDLAVISTGSLLDFTLAEHTFSMPVGRIEYLYLEPLSFEEFLQAKNKIGLLDYIKEYRLTSPVPESIHEQGMELFKEYMIIGGLPQAIHNWIQTQSLVEVNKTHHHLLSTYRDDFGKYRGRAHQTILDDVFLSIPQQLAKKFTYQKVNPDKHISSIKQALQLLNKARVCHKVNSSFANGVPLGAEVNEKYFKTIFIDVGLCSAQLGLNLSQIQSTQEINLVNKGGIAEQVAGQILRTLFPSYIDPSLFCWIRNEAGTNSEIDYLLQHQSNIIPIEIKAGTSGTLKSLHYFMEKKKLDFAVRINSDYPSITPIHVKDTTGNAVSYTLLSLPFYLLGQLHRLIDQANLVI